MKSRIILTAMTFILPFVSAYGFNLTEETADTWAVTMITLIITIFFYVLPAAIASSRKHNDRYAIAAINIILGWTILGWIIAFIWCLTGNVEKNNQGIAAAKENI